MHGCSNRANFYTGLVISAEGTVLTEMVIKLTNKPILEDLDLIKIYISQIAGTIG